MAKEGKGGEGEGDWMEEWFKSKGVTEDEDKSFLKSRALADEFVDEARKRRAPKPSEKGKGIFGGRNRD